jgi:hypothetical protein
MDQVALLEGLLTLCVIMVQMRCFLATRRRSLVLANLFPDSEPLAEIVPSTLFDPLEDNSIIESTRIQATEFASPGFNSILASTNRYLEKNAGTPADFRILQDIAERISNSTEQAAASNATLPLYVGLMGTFIGVIVGLLSFVGAGSSLSEAGAFTDPDHLRHFLGGVLVAMAGSLCGLFLSVIGRSRFLHNAQEKNDRLKQAYFTLLQTELLPVVGHDFSSALYSLQQNLHRFNADFSSNLATFTASMGTATETLRQQRELLDMLKSTDILRIIEANADMLRTSGKIGHELRGFVEATEALHGKLQITSGLTDKFSALLDRFGVFEQSVNSLGEKLAVDETITAHAVKLIRDQLESLKSRTELIRQFVDSEDDEIKRYIEVQRHKLEDLVDSARQQLDDLAGQIANSIANALSEGQGTAFVKDVARLQGIDTQMQGLAALVGQMQQSSKEAESALLEAIKDGLGGLSPALNQNLAKLSSIDGHIARVETSLASAPMRPARRQTPPVPQRAGAPKKENGNGSGVWWWPWGGVPKERRAQQAQQEEDRES